MFYVFLWSDPEPDPTKKYATASDYDPSSIFIIDRDRGVDHWAGESDLTGAVQQAAASSTNQDPLSRPPPTQGTGSLKKSTGSRRQRQTQVFFFI